MQCLCMMLCWLGFWKQRRCIGIASSFMRVSVWPCEGYWENVGTQSRTTIRRRISHECKCQWRLCLPYSLPCIQYVIQAVQQTKPTAIKHVFVSGSVASSLHWPDRKCHSHDAICLIFWSLLLMLLMMMLLWQRYNRMDHNARNEPNPEFQVLNAVCGPEWLWVLVITMDGFALLWHRLNESRQSEAIPSASKGCSGGADRVLVFHLIIVYFVIGLLHGDIYPTS